MGKWSVIILFCAGTFSGQGMTFATLSEMARDLAQKPYQAQPAPLPSAIRDLSYDQRSQIEFDHRFTLWKNLPFQAEFIYPGGVIQNMVELFELEHASLKPIAFEPQLFQYGTNRFPLPTGLGFGGVKFFALRHGEFAAFAGATYFRMIGWGEQYGASARVVAVDTTEPGGEEFPAFTKMWMQRPESQDRALLLFGLIDSPALAGAAAFEMLPGNETVCQVEVAIFPRREIKRLGLAPLTSMFKKGGIVGSNLKDERPEVHDSDGLLLQDVQGTWLWHPLGPGRMIRENSFANVTAFGLLQRKRDPADYNDPRVRYENRPNTWITFTRPPGEGSVQLLQLPTDNEFTDNVVAMWVPRKPVPPKESIGCRYALHWGTNEPQTRFPRITQTRIEQNSPAELKITVSFAGAAKVARPLVEVNNGGKATQTQWRASPPRYEVDFMVALGTTNKATELSLVLADENKPVSEKWNYTWQP